MLIKTRAIVLHAFKYGESSLITECYTEALGVRRYILSGVRSRKPRFAASLFQVLSPLELVVYHREEKELNRLKEARPAWVLQSIPFDHRRGAVAMFLAELIRKTVRESEKNPDLFAFLFRSVRELDDPDRPITNLPLYFMLQLSVRLGFAPAGSFQPSHPFFLLDEGFFAERVQGHKYFLEPPLSAWLSKLLAANWSTAMELGIPAVERRQLLDQMLLFFRLHLEHFPGLNSVEILRRVMGG